MADGDEEEVGENAVTNTEIALLKLQIQQLRSMLEGWTGELARLPAANSENREESNDEEKKSPLTLMNLFRRQETLRNRMKLRVRNR